MKYPYIRSSLSTTEHLGGLRDLRYHEYFGSIVNCQYYLEDTGCQSTAPETEKNEDNLDNQSRKKLSQKHTVFMATAKTALRKRFLYFTAFVM